MVASELFDHPVKEDATNRFLTDPNHHLLIAYVDDTPVGFVSGAEITHPDKGTDMFLNELGVDERYRRRGFGRTLVRSLADLGAELGCKGMFVLTEDDNPAALATYRSAGAAREGDRPVMLEWQLSNKSTNEGEQT
ncbi:MAG: GNAT family N-acetyltransferase [Acidimicrobiia bacterium]|nr:GNAT family N-acetyltransferase [Acidimicrobiia bacterium]